MRKGRRLAKFLFWSLVVSATLVGCAAWFAYAFVTDSDTAARLIRAQAGRFLSQSILDLGRVRFRPFAGDLTISQIYLRQRIDGVSFLTAKIPWLGVKLDARRLFHGQFEAREITVNQPTLRLVRRDDGTWNLQGLLASPWPALTIEKPPPIVIRNGTVELVCDESQAQAPNPNRVAVERKPIRALDIDLSHAGGTGPPLERAATGNTTATAGAQNPATATVTVPPQSLEQIPGTLASGESVALLRDVNLRIEAATGGLYHFEGSARGDLFDRLRLEGTLDPTNGDLTLMGELAGFTVSETLHRRLPPEALPSYEAMKITGGEIDLELTRMEYRPGAPAGGRLQYELMGWLHGGVWECPKLPFPINDLSALVSVREGVLTIKHAEGRNGTTTVRAEGSMGVGDPKTSPFDLRVDLLELELDKRLKKQTPPEFAELWDVFKPRGRISTFVHLVRAEEAGPVGVGATVVCRDVSAVYQHFPYPLESLNGQLALEGQRLTVDLRTLIGGRPAGLKGVIDNPGADAIVRLGIEADAIPIDDTFKSALPPDVRKVVDRFNPSGSVKASVRVFREPMSGPGSRPEGHLTIDADLDLNPRCEITWADLPFPIRNLTGHLELHPDRWEFKNVRGRNGQAIIAGSGRVEKLPGPNLPNGEPPLRVDLELLAENLPFNEDLRKALPLAWRKTWSTINPTGASDVEAKIHTEPGRPDANHITIVPRPESSVRLEITPKGVPGQEPPSSFDLRMEDVRGRFEFINGKVSMHDGLFLFHGAPVQFERGWVQVEDSGRFTLSVEDIWVKAIRFDSALRRIMPPLMAQFALRLDDGRPFTARGNLQIGWSGVQEEPAWCRWEKTLVILNGNSLKMSTPLEHIQGELNNVSGWSNGLGLEVHGKSEIASVSVHGLQVTQLKAPFHIEGGTARLDGLNCRLLAGDLIGSGSISLDVTPKYSATLRLTGAQLQEYARMIPGRQTFRGTLNAAIELNGLGTDVRSLQGRGEAYITQGDLGELPVALRFLKVLNSSLLNPPRTPGKTAFDSADVEFRIVNGVSILDPIKLTGTAFSLQGRGVRDPLGNLDIRLKVLYGRDRFQIPIVSGAIREASGQIFIIHGFGPASNPQFVPEALPQMQRLGIRKSERNP